MNKYNPKQKQILVTGKNLFWKFGFRRVTIEEICREAGVSKMTFYKYFPNKVELATTILNDVFEESLEKIRKLGEEHECPELTLKKILQLKSEGSAGIGEEFIKDLYSSDPELGLAKFMEEKTALVFREINNLYEKGKKDGWVRRDLNIPFMLYMAQKMVDIMTKEETSRLFENSQDMIMEVTRLFVYGISPHD